MMINSRSGKRGMRICASLCVLIMLFLSACAAESGAPSPKRTVPRSVPKSHYRLSDFSQWVEMDTFIAEWMLRSRLGEFQRLIFATTEIPNHPGLYNVKTDFYTYIFEEKIGDRSQRLNFNVEKLNSDGVVNYSCSQISSVQVTATAVNQNDLRTIEGDGYYLVRDIRYHYYQRRLSCIHWTTESYAFTLDFDEENIQDYDLDNGTFASQFLRESTAEQAVDDFNAHIARCLAWYKFCRYWLPWILVVVVSCATIGTVYLILRRKKKKKTAPAE